MTAPRWVAALVSAALAVGLVPTAAIAAVDGDGSVEIGVQKFIERPGEGTVTYGPGDTFTYLLAVECSSLDSDGCVNMAVSDVVPEPLILESTSIGSPTGWRNDSDVASNTVEWTATSPLGGSDVGMTVGTTQITVLVRIPDDITWEQAQQLGEITNTATVSADASRPLQVGDDSTIVIEVPQVLEADAVKSADDHMGDSGRPIPAVPGRPVDFQIGGGNTSNRPVETITIVDPAAGSSGLEYLDLTSLGPVTPPAGADQFALTYTDVDGVTHDLGVFPAPIDSVPLDGIAPGTIAGFSLTFSSSEGTLLPIADGSDDYAAIGVGSLTNDRVEDLPEGESIDIENVVEVTVAADGAEASDTASDGVTVTNTPPGVSVTKGFNRNVLLPGESTVAEIRADNGGKDVTSLTIADPVAGQPDFRDQGLVFGGFTDDVEWPEVATQVQVTYTYADGTTETLTGDDRQSIPAAAQPDQVVGFSVTFTGEIEAQSYALLPFDVTALPVDGEADISATNTVESSVVDADGKEATAEDDAVITRRPVFVDTTVAKNIVKDDVWGVPGSSTVVQLAGSVDESSSVGSEYLTIQDPADPSSAPSPFWNAFDLSAVGPVEVPSNATMTAEYWNGSEWVEFPDQPVAAGDSWSYVVPEGSKGDIQGVRFRFEPSEEGGLLPPGFNVLPYFKVELRDDLRDGSGPAAGVDEDTVFTNDVQSEVFNSDSGEGPVTAQDDDSITVTPIDGDGADLVDKSWTPDELIALSAADTSATLSWGTRGIPMDTMTLTDPADAQTAPIETTAYDAFDLVSVGPINASNDPAMKFDQVYVQRLTTAGDWVDLGNCTEAKPCRGSLAKYTLTASERDDTIGVRFVFSERPDRASVVTNPTLDPAPGSGVAETADLSRKVPLTLRLRDYLRSNPQQPVLGVNHDYGYNTGTAGVVRNTVSAESRLSGDIVNLSNDADDITILDQPQNVSLSKRFVDWDPDLANPATDSPDVELVGVPQSGTPADQYPVVTAVLLARNESASRVSTMSIVDPDPSASTTADQTILDHFDLFAISEVVAPEGADPDATRVRLTPAVDGVTDFTVAQARALSPDQLADVTSVDILFTGAKGADGAFDTLISSGAQALITLDYRLRTTLRSSGEPLTPYPDGTLWVNNARVDQTRPGADATGPVDETIAALASDDLQVRTPTYGVDVTKVICAGNPSVGCSDARAENDPDRSFSVSLNARPTGTVRTVAAAVTDLDPTFWNAFAFAGMRPTIVPSPIRQVRLDALVGVDYAVDSVTKEITATCEGSGSLDACWVEGAWTTTPSAPTAFTAEQLDAILPSGISRDAVRGIRMSYRKADGSTWERPSNPRLALNFTVAPRDYLIVGPDGGSDTPVPTTRPGLAPAPGEQQAGIFADTVEADTVGAWPTQQGGQRWTAHAEATDNAVLTHTDNGVSVSKTHGRETATSNRDTFSPGAEIPYSIRVENTGGWPISGLTLTDQVGVDAYGPLLAEPAREVDDPTPIYKASVGGTPLEGFDGSLDADGVITFSVPEDFVLEPGEVLDVVALLVFRQTPTPVQPTTRVPNSVTITSDRFFDTCDYTVQGADQPQIQDVAECASSTEATPAPISPIGTSKAVRGVGAGVPGSSVGDPNYDDLGVLGLNIDDAATYCAAPNAGDGFYRAPCVPITRPGGIEEWRLDFSNNGNIPITRITSIDTLPAVGDTGVILASGRSSRWSPIFLGGFASTFAAEGGSVQIFYATSVPNRACNEAEIQYENGGISPIFASCTTEVTVDRPQLWKPYSDALPADQKAAIKAFKLVGDFSANPLQPNEKVAMTFRTQTPWFADRAEDPASGPDPIAWNSFASGAVGAYNGPVQSAVVEPRRVGVASATGQLRFVKDVAGIDPAWGVTFPDDYAFTLACTSGGQPVPLVDDAGADMSQVRLASDGTPLVYNDGSGTWGTVNLPLYADCRIAENAEDPSSQGASVSYVPAGDGEASGSVPALRFDVPDDVARPAPAGDPASASVSILNEYLPGGFSVTKAVDNGGAVDQDGNPLIYDRDYTFAARCSFLDQTVLDETFTLSDGESRTFDNLPAGARCRIEETGAGGAADTSVVVTEGGVAGAPAPVAEFDVQASSESGEPITTAAFTNTYTVGAVEITKQVTGAQQWADATFELQTTCTLEGVDPNPVYSGSQRLRAPDELVWRIQDLPTGAVCIVTESEDGGANASSGPITLVVGDDNDAAVTGTITNSFTTGDLVVTKALAGAPGAELAPATNDTYDITLSCTREVNGSTVDVAIPGGAVRTITGAGSATYEGLPTGASCAIEESDVGFATSHEFSPAGPYTIGTEGEPVEVTLTNTFANGSVSLQKSVDAPEGFPVPGDVTVTLTCTWQGADVPLVDDGVVTLVPGGAAEVVEDIPVGSVCDVAEDDAGQTMTTVNPRPIVVTDDERAVEVAIDNTYEWASLEVGKLVDSASAFVPTRFGFTVTCEFEGKTVLDESFTLDADQVRTFTEIPARSRCVVTETDDRGADGTIVAADVPGASGPLAPQIDQETRMVVIPELQAGENAAVNTVTFTNLYDSTSVVLVKDFAGAGADQFGRDQEFTFSVTCELQGETVLERRVVLTASTGWSSAISDVVPGSECRVVEEGLNGADAVVITPNDGIDTSVGTGIVPQGGGLVTVTATNWYLTGSLEVTKTIAGDGAELYGTSDFTLELACVRDGEQVDIPEGAQRTVSASMPTALWQHLPTGAECSLTETDDGGAHESDILDANGDVVGDEDGTYTFTVVTDPTVLSVDDQPQEPVEVRNTFHLAQVSVTKTVDSSGAVDSDGQPVLYGPFEVALTCTWNGEDVVAAEPMTRPIADGETLTWTSLPEGAECAVTETNTAGASSTTATVTEAGADADAQTSQSVSLAPLPPTSSSDQTTVAFMNTFEVASLTITKLVDGSGSAEVTRTFPVSVTCVLVDPSHPAPGLVTFDGTFDIGAGENAVVSDVPAGSVCEVVETDSGKASRTTMTVGRDVTEATSVTVTLAAGSSQVLITNTFTAPLPATGGSAVPIGALLLLSIVAAVSGIALVRRRRMV